MFDRIENDMHDFMKKQDKFSLSVIRMLKSVIQLETIAKKTKLTDDEIISVIKRQVKIRRDSIEEYKKYSKLDTIKDLQKEIDILNKYLPEELPETEIIKIIDQVISEINSPSIKNMGEIMKKVSEIVGVRADMSQVSYFVKEKLSKNL